jgi:hypothetical protein
MAEGDIEQRGENTTNWEIIKDPVEWGQILAAVNEQDIRQKLATVIGASENAMSDHPKIAEKKSYFIKLAHDTAKKADEKAAILTLLLELGPNNYLPIDRSNPNKPTIDFVEVEKLLQANRLFSMGFAASNRALTESSHPSIKTEQDIDQELDILFHGKEKDSSKEHLVDKEALRQWMRANLKRLPADLDRAVNLEKGGLPLSWNEKVDLLFKEYEQVIDGNRPKNWPQKYYEGPMIATLRFFAIPKAPMVNQSPTEEV